MRAVRAVGREAKQAACRGVLPICAIAHNVYYVKLDLWPPKRLDSYAAKVSTAPSRFIFLNMTLGGRLASTWRPVIKFGSAMGEIMYKTKMGFDDFLGGDSDTPNNSLKMNRLAPFWRYQNFYVRKIRLRGTGWDGSHHQELLIHLQQNVLLRISRNNGEDTFQIGANEGRYNDLVERHVSENTITCRQVFAAFGRERNAHPTYEHANCRTFVQNIFRDLDPGADAEFKEASNGRGDDSKLVADLFGL